MSLYYQYTSQETASYSPSDKIVDCFKKMSCEPEKGRIASHRCLHSLLPCNISSIGGMYSFTNHSHSSTELLYSNSTVQICCLEHKMNRNRIDLGIFCVYSFTYQ